MSLVLIRYVLWCQRLKLHHFILTRHGFTEHGFRIDGPAKHPIGPIPEPAYPTGHIQTACPASDTAQVAK